jgi:subtilisin family serine protease
MLGHRVRRYRALNHVQGLPFDPPRWGERPRLRDKQTLSEGTGTTVAVLDSGVSDHEWLRGSFAEHPLPEEARGLWDLSAAALPRHVGHGTFVCGVVLHYAPATRLVPRRVLDFNGDAEDDQLAATIRGLISRDPDVVNLSLGPTPVDEPDETDEGIALTVEALKDLQQKCGTVVVVAAGHVGEEMPAEQIAPSGSLSLVVGALDLSGQPAWFSGKQPVTIWAPGTDILSSFVYFPGPVSLDHPAADHSHRHSHEPDPDAPPAPVQQPLAPFEGWARWNGTSFAAPAVAGAVAAQISALATAEPETPRRELRERAVQQVLGQARRLAGGVALSAAPVALMGPPVS